MNLSDGSMDWHLIDPNQKLLNSIAVNGINAARNRDPNIAPANNAIAPIGEKFGGQERNRATTPTRIKAVIRTTLGRFTLVAELGTDSSLESFLALLLDIFVPLWNSTDQKVVQQFNVGTLNL